MGRQGVPKRWPSPTIAAYSAMRAFFSSGPRSERRRFGMVPDRNMQMENILRAEKEGVIAKINAAEGESLAVDAVILELE